MDFKEKSVTMIMLNLPEGQVRTLMSLLLTRDAFDVFDLRSVTVQSFVRFNIEGLVAAETGREDQGTSKKAVFCKWRQIRPFVYNIIKDGNEKPRFIKVILSYPYERTIIEYPDARALFVNIVFDRDSAHITTGVSMKTFSFDKNTEHLWDSLVEKSLRRHGLDVQKNGE